MREAGRHLGWLLALALGLSACGGAEPTPTSPASAPPGPTEKASAPPPPASAAPIEGTKPKPDLPPPGSSPSRVMQAHFQDALLIRKAVIAGTPEQAANPATVLTLIQNLDDLPAGWREYVERMQRAAKRVTDSTSAAQTAAATADLGVSCGLCHQKLGGPATSSEPAPAEGTTVEARMKRHAWATERLWEALVVPSNKSWDEGAKALSVSPFPPEVLARGGVHARSAATDFGKLTARAPAAKSIEDKAQLYSELLITCGICHRAQREAATP